MHYQALLYRALNPIRAREPMSGEGARLHGGRFNPKGVPALYPATSVMTAIREANQIGTLQPTTLVSYEADINPIFDATDAEALGAYDMTPAELAAEDWRWQMRAHGKAPTQILAEKLIADGYAGLRVPSFAKGATGEDLNMVLWVWGSTLPTKLVLIDDEGRLRQ
ncbi:RES domain-containing protein [Pseudotabrizicola sediminis]|uniref:RES domain-containing protein n=1 Tax=Pseudotabrizicola sediminis TaxID=2486418 RepID=A0ABY2KKK0_9RHOB|nr:RES domain-containing protein [Pseudotabrizicola sediminis]TGD41690.1 RES domain-containing protein [Pseudotabrizicola sediminis]